jgi:hypothetical protein
MKKKSRNIPIGVVLCVFIMSFTSHVTAAVLTEIRLGKHNDFSRIVFEFKDDVQYQLESDNASGHVSIIFHDTTSKTPAPVIKENSVCIDDLAISQEDKNLAVRIAVSATRFRLNPFTIKDPFRVVLDITCLEETKAVSARSQPEPGPAISDKPPAVVLSNNPAKKPESDIAMEEMISVPGDIQPLPSEETTVFQNYLIAILAVLSLIILGLAVVIIFQYWTTPEKSLQGGSAKTLKHSEDMLSSIDAEIRQKLRTHGEHG